MTIPERLQEIAGSEKVTILVGPSKTEFKFDKNILCQASKYFSAAFNSGFEEGRTGVILMTEDSPIIFELFLRWIYSSDLPKAKGTASHGLLYDLYILAEKLCMDDLANKTMDRIRETHEATYMKGDAVQRHFKHVGHILDQTAGSSPLRDFILCIMIHDIKLAATKIVGVGQTISRENLMKAWDVALVHPEFYEEFFSCLLTVKVVETPDEAPLPDKALEEVRDFLFADDKCIFHKHTAGEVCYLAKSDVKKGEEEVAALSEEDS